MPGRPGSAHLQHSPLMALHSSATSRIDDFGAYQSNSRPSSRADDIPSDAAAHASRSRSHHERPSTSHQQPRLLSSADAGRYPPSYMHGQQQHPPPAGALYQDSYSSRRADIGPPPFSAHSVGSQQQSMLLPPPISRSRPHSPLRYEGTSEQDPAPAPYRSRTGVDDLSPQMASTSITSRHPALYQYSQQEQQRSSRERDDRREAYAHHSSHSSHHPSSSRTAAADPYGKVDDWRSQQRQHQHQHQHQLLEQERQDRQDKHRRMDSGIGVPPLTLPPLGAALSDRLPGRGHSASVSRSMAGTAPGIYTPSLGRSSRDASPATTPGGSQGSANRMGWGHLMD